MIYTFLSWIAGVYLLQLQKLRANDKRKHQPRACTNAWHKHVTRYLSIYLFIYVFVVSSYAQNLCIYYNNGDKMWEWEKGGGRKYINASKKKAVTSRLGRRILPLLCLVFAAMRKTAEGSGVTPPVSKTRTCFWGRQEVNGWGRAAPEGP